MNGADPKLNQIDELFTRGVGEFIDPQGAFRKKLETNPDQVVIKFGVDPTRPDIHLGHAVVLHKLRKLQDMGCKVIFLVGDITAKIGDPTGKSKIRPEISNEEIVKNMGTYLDQVGKILKTDESVFDWTVNSDWFVTINDILAPERKLDFKKDGQVVYVTDVLPGSDIFNKAGWWLETRRQKKNINSYTFVTLLAILRNISHARLVERDMFQDRIEKEEPIFMHEMLYPVIQGIDSDAIAGIYGSCDLEVGGTDQHFNMLVGREVMQMTNKTPQAVLSFKLLVGLDGKEKMSKSLENYVAITDEPNDMYGKVMSIPDTLIESYFELCTFTPLDEIKIMCEKMNEGSLNPKDAKMNLARQITEIYHGQKKALLAEESWEATFSKKEIPEDVLEISVDAKSLLVDALVQAQIVSSKSDFRRLVDEGAITNLSTEQTIDSPTEEAQEGVYRIGKKRFCKIIIT